MTVPRTPAADVKDVTPGRQLVTAKVIAKHTTMPLSTVYDRARTGRIPGAIRIGRRFVFDLEKVDAWMNAGGDLATEPSTT